MSNSVVLEKVAEVRESGDSSHKHSGEARIRRILLVAPFTLLHDEEGYNRFRYIAEMLSERFQVTLVTSSFNHPKKSHRKYLRNYGDLPYKLCLLNESGYRRNVSVRRVKSHRQFIVRLREYLSTRDREFDYVYAAFPLIGSAKCCGAYARRNGIPFYIDVQDVWPESILVVFRNFQFFVKILMLPWTFEANRVYKSADAVVSVSQTYIDRVMRVNSKASKVLPLFIGVDLDSFDQVAVNSPKGIDSVYDEVVGVYCGSISHSYDVETVILASAEVKRAGFSFRLLVIGSGQFEDSMRALAVRVGAPVEFLGYQPFDRMVEVLKSADIGFHAIASDSQSSMTNKFSDYCAAGLAIFNSSKNAEICSLVDAGKMGCNYSAGNARELANLVLSVANDPVKLSSFQVCSRDFAEKYLDRKTIYKQLFELFQ